MKKRNTLAHFKRKYFMEKGNALFGKMKQNLACDTENSEAYLRKINTINLV